jgi:hypothetical protein
VLRALSSSSAAIANGRLAVGAGTDPAEAIADTNADRLLRGATVVARPVSPVSPPAELGLGAGRPLDPAVIERFAALGGSIRTVRVHDDAAAARATRELGARAFALGGHIVFGRGEYQPHAASGERLMAHELGHVAQGESRPIARRERDFTAEADRIETSKLTLELERVRERIAALDDQGATSSPEREALEREALALERVVMARDVPRIAHEKRVRATRKIPLLALTTLGAQFGDALYAGYSSEIPPGTMRENARAMLTPEGQSQQFLGYLRGLPDGLWHGAVNLVEGLGMIVQVVGGLAIDALPGIELYRMSRDPVGYRARQEAKRQRILAVFSAVKAFAIELFTDPTILSQMSADLGFHLGQELAQVIAEFSSQDLFSQGRRIGDIAGQILFEVILALATEGASVALRVGAKAVETGHATGRIAALIRRITASSPAMRRLVRAIAGLEEGVEAARAVERTGEAATAMNRESKLAGVESRVDDAAKKLQSVPEPPITKAPESPIAKAPEPPIAKAPEPPIAKAPEPKPTPAVEPKPTPAVEPKPTPAVEPTAAPKPADVTPSAKMNAPPAPDAATLARREAAALERAQGAGNFDTVKSYVGKPLPDPLPPDLAKQYRIVKNPHQPPPQALRRIEVDAQDKLYAKLSVDKDGTVRFAERGRPRPDVPFDPELATPIEVAPQSRLRTTDKLGDGRTVKESVDTRRKAQLDAEALRKKGDLEGATAKTTVMRKESERLGEVAGKRYMEGVGDLAHNGKGANTFDLVYRNKKPPPQFTVLEAKGGGATNTSSRVGADGRRYQQGTEDYLRSIIDDSLRTPPKADLPRKLALELEDALDNGALDYVEITQKLKADGGLGETLARKYF